MKMNEDEFSYRTPGIISLDKLVTSKKEENLGHAT